MARLIDFIQSEFVPSFSVGFVAGAILAGAVAGIRSVVVLVIRVWRRA